LHRVIALLSGEIGRARGAGEEPRALALITAIRIVAGIDRDGGAHP
jgi:hypothetical protein